MSVCSICEKEAMKVKDGFTRLERIHLLASATAMAQTIWHGSGRATEQDRLVSSSVASKLILSLEPEIQEPMLKMFREASGVDIVVNCPHSKLVLV